MHNVLLCRSNVLPKPGTYVFWFSITGTVVNLDETTKLPDLASRLETAYEASRNVWWQLGRAMASEPSANCCHAPTGGVYGSDFGLMLAWSRIIDELKNSPETILVVCDDAWMFRHLANFAHVQAGKAPNLFWRRIKMIARGFAARCQVTLRAIQAVISLSHHQQKFKNNAPAMLVYGHPESRIDGHDAYFGDFLNHAPKLQRLLHVDCPTNRALELSAHETTLSLHGWGRVSDAFRLLFEYWRPSKQLCAGRYGWIIRRAAALENSGGGPAMVRWQMLCQRRFIQISQPNVIFWPWENFAWERDLCRAANTTSTRTAGYQHTAIGPHQINYAAFSNPDGGHSLPDQIIANGPAYKAELLNWGHDKDRVVIGGSWRITERPPCHYNKNGPVFVPLSGQLSIARQQIKCAQSLAEHGISVLVKEHPMYPVKFTETKALKRTAIGLFNQPSIRAMVFTTGTSGLEALLGGIPAYRLLLDDHISVNILPSGIIIPSSGIEQIKSTLSTPTQPPLIRWDELFSTPEPAFWHNLVMTYTASSGNS